MRAPTPPPQIILDENGDQVVTSEEFLAAAKSALQLMKAKATDPAVAKVLDSMSTYLYKNTVRRGRRRDGQETKQRGWGGVSHFSVKELS